MEILWLWPKRDEIKSALLRNTQTAKNTYKYVVCEVLFLVKLHALIHNFSSGAQSDLADKMKENLKTNRTEANKVKNIKGDIS